MKTAFFALIALATALYSAESKPSDKAPQVNVFSFNIEAPDDDIALFGITVSVSQVFRSPERVRRLPERIVAYLWSDGPKGELLGQATVSPGFDSRDIESFKAEFPDIHVDIPKGKKVMFRVALERSVALHYPIFFRKQLKSLMSFAASGKVRVSNETFDLHPLASRDGR